MWLSTESVLLSTVSVDSKFYKDGNGMVDSADSEINITPVF